MGGCTLENVTFSDDAADEGAAEISLKSGAASVTHATVFATDTPAIERVAGTLMLKNSVVDGGACVGEIADGGGNVQSAPGLCAAGFATGDPALSDLDDHGGGPPRTRSATAARRWEPRAAVCRPTSAASPGLRRATPARSSTAPCRRC
jgi:hypothetical protein